MFHFDPADFLCPVYLQRNTAQTYNFHFVPDKSSNKTSNIKVTATSA